MTNNNPSGALEIISEENNVLPVVFRYLLDNNTANAAPYHNLHHLLSVMYYCNEGCKYHSIIGVNRVSVLVAALFHDYNHSQGYAKDYVNVSVALNSVNQWYKGSKFTTEVDIDKVIEIIKATEYPYVIESKDLSIEQAIIRDADLMPSLDTDWLNNMIVGLMKEMKVDSFESMTDGQKAFHSGIKMVSPWGQSIYKVKWSQVFRNLELLGDLFKK